jgi:hypothetical protein
MRLVSRRTVPTLGLTLLFATIGSAGPSYNSNRKELASLSRDAGAALHRALSDIHLMLESLEQVNPGLAEQRRSDALKNLDTAIGNFKQISEKAPEQKLIMEPHTNLEKNAVESLPQALKRRGIEFPHTEKELAQVATKLVSDFRTTVADSKRFDKTSTRAYAYFQKLFREEGFLLYVGLSVSLIWDMQDVSQR